MSFFDILRPLDDIFKAIPESYTSWTRGQTFSKTASEISMNRMLQIAGLVASLNFFTPSLQAAENQAFGAATPFVTLEAESPANKMSGKIVKLTAPPSPGASSPELEASGLAYVELSKTGDFIEFTCPKSANALVIRHCIPDAPEGGGITATLGLYLHGKRIQSLSLSSKHNWLYGKTGKPGENGQDNSPTEYPHVFWDETRTFIDVSVKAGDVIRLQKDASDTAVFYRIDLVEPEFVSPPLTRPANSLSVADYGANGKDATVDTAAFSNCIDEARAQKKSVWVPAGVFLQNARFYLDGVSVQGAGMWHTKLLAVPSGLPHRFGGYCGFSPNGVGASVSDLSIEGFNDSRKDASMAFTGTGTNWAIRRVWMSHLGVGLWMGGENAVVSECRVRTTYADGININNGKVLLTRNVLVENNHVRGTGDDGIAILSHELSPYLTENIVVRHNTVAAAWWGYNIDVAGGKGHTVENNLIQDSAGLTINLPAAYPMYPLTDSILRRNLIVRSGNNKNGQRRGAVWIYAGSTQISNVEISENRISDSFFSGIHLTGGKSQDLVFRNNLIERPGDDGVAVDKPVLGSAFFTKNAVRELSQGKRALPAEIPGGWALRAEGNNW